MLILFTNGDIITDVPEIVFLFVPLCKDLHTAIERLCVDQSATTADHCLRILHDVDPLTGSEILDTWRVLDFS